MTRLIDADALKKAIKDNGYSHYFEIFDIIDNAPTVEASNIIDGLNNEIDDLSENLAWYINERNRLLKERRSKSNEVEDFKKFVESRLDMQDLYLPIHFFDLLDEYCGTDKRGGRK